MLLELRHISKRFPGVLALDRVSLTVRAGEIHGLVGENGAGKSTLIKILTGIHTPDTGALFWRGERVRIDHPRVAAELGVAVIHQHRHLVPFFSGYENLFLGKPYPKKVGGRIAWRELRRQARQLQDELGFSLDLTVPVSRLSPAQQTMVEVMRAFHERADLLILDEPTAALSDEETERLFAAIRKFQQQGTAFLYVSHRLEEILQLSERVTVLRNGTRVGTWATAELDRGRLITAMAGADAVGELPRPQNPRERLALSVKGLTSRCGRIRNVNFHVKAGEVFGLFGLVGAGRSELLHMLYGVKAIGEGAIELDGSPVRLASPEEALRQGISLIPEDRHRQGLVLGMNVRENMTLALLRQFRAGFGVLPGGAPIVSQARERRYVGDMIQRLRIATPGAEQKIARLSGGNQQKVVFGKALLGEVQVLLCDEPTLGVDVGARREIYRLICDLAQQGTAVVFASSDLREVLGLSHRIGIMRNGALAAVLPASQADPRRVLEICYGQHMKKGTP